MSADRGLNRASGSSASVSSSRVAMSSSGPPKSDWLALLAGPFGPPWSPCEMGGAVHTSQAEYGGRIDRQH